MREAGLSNDIRLALSVGENRLWRNNVGQYQAKSGHIIRYGVCNPGGSDLLGWRSLVITQDMVGKRLAQFVALEVKTKTGVRSDAQINFIDVVLKSGGCGAFVQSVDEAADVIRSK